MNHILNFFIVKIKSHAFFRFISPVIDFIIP